MGTQHSDPIYGQGSVAEEKLKDGGLSWATIDVSSPCPL